MASEWRREPLGIWKEDEQTSLQKKPNNDKKELLHFFQNK